MESKTYRIVVLGTIGSGKSQLCDFFINNRNNSTFRVGDSPYLCTKIPECHVFHRADIKIEIIDSCADDSDSFKLLIDMLRTKKTIDLLILVINYNHRFNTEETRQYLKLISETFTPREFYNHLAIVFSHYFEKPSKKDENKLSQKAKEIKDLLGEIIGSSDDGLNAIEPNIYAIDTEKDDDDNFIEKFQQTIDCLIYRMKNNIQLFGPISTESIQFKGVKDRLLAEKHFSIESNQFKEVKNQRAAEKLEEQIEKMKKLEEEYLNKKKLYERLKNSL